MSKNTYDEKDMIKREGALAAGGLKIAVYRVRDPETMEWSNRQFHMTCNNIVLCVMPEEAAKLFATFVNMQSDNNVQNMRDVITHLENQIRILEGRPDPNQKDLFKSNEGENND